MKINFQNPSTGGQFSEVVDNDQKLRGVIDKSLGDEVDGKTLGYPGYVFRITGGSDRDGFPMKQGVRLNSRVKLLIKPGTVGFRAHWARPGERKRKTVRGCIVANDIASLNLVVLASGDNKIEALEKVHDKLLFPKRASKIRRLLNLPVGSNILKHVPKTKHTSKAGKVSRSRIRVQRLVTPAARRRRELKVEAKRARQAKSATLKREYQHKVDRLAKLSVQRKSAAAKLLQAKKDRKTLRTSKALSAPPVAPKVAPKPAVAPAAAVAAGKAAAPAAKPTGKAQTQAPAPAGKAPAPAGKAPAPAGKAAVVGGKVAPQAGGKAAKGKAGGKQ